MQSYYGMTKREYLFGLIISFVHAAQHLFFRVLPPLIPILLTSVETSLSQLGFLVTVYVFAGGLFQAPMGILSDRIDRKRLLPPAFIAMGTGYLFFVLAPVAGRYLPAITLFSQSFSGAYQIMALGMFIAGIGYSIIHPVGYPLISANISPEHKGKVLGMWGSASKAGDAAAPLVIGFFIVMFSWESIVIGISIFGFLFAFALYLIFSTGTYETRPPSSGANDSTSGIMSNESDRYPRRLLLPLIVVVMVFFFILFASNGLMTFAPVFVSEVYGYSLTLAGIPIQAASVANFYFGVMMISGAVAQLFVGGLSDKYDHRAVVIVLLSISSLGLLALALVPLGPIPLLIVFLLLGGTLFGLNPARDALISDITPPAYEGRTFGYVWTLALIGTAVYPVVIGYLADRFGLRASFGALVIGSVAGILSVLLLYDRRIVAAGAD